MIHLVFNSVDVIGKTREWVNADRSLNVVRCCRSTVWLRQIERGAGSLLQIEQTLSKVWNNGRKFFAINIDVFNKSGLSVYTYLIFYSEILTLIVYLSSCATYFDNNSATRRNNNRDTHMSEIVLVIFKCQYKLLWLKRIASAEYLLHLFLLLYLYYN